MKQLSLEELNIKEIGTRTPCVGKIFKILPQTTVYSGSKKCVLVIDIHIEDFCELNIVDLVSNFFSDKFGKSEYIHCIDENNIQIVFIRSSLSFPIDDINDFLNNVHEELIAKEDYYYYKYWTR